MIDSDRIYSPSPDEKQLTPRSIVIGSLVGSIVACTNIYIGLKIGWTFGASIVSAVLGFAIFSARDLWRGARSRARWHPS